ncbi:hypothetical protein Tco_0873831 [Tanacetum coccineum]|uniref:Uncharacterized protein n=1 Tax=Tanacetum coccineum TaxID=301880 RepID=A0ABQ5BK00_9ASTR
MEKGCCLSSDSAVDCSKGRSRNPTSKRKCFDLMAAVADLDEIEEVNANCILMANLQQASTSEEQYTEILEPTPEPHQVQQYNVISNF